MLSRSPWERFRSDRRAVACLLILCAELLAVLLLPPLLGLEPNASDLGASFWAPPSAAHPLGTDDVGRDLLARLLCGGRVSLLIGLCSAALSALVGIPLGLLAGYRRGAWEFCLMRLADVFQSFPSIVLVLCLVSLVGPSALNLVLVLGLLGSSQAALAAEESPAPLPGWSHSILADGYSLGLFGDEIGVQHSQTVTMEQVEALARTVGDKLALLDLEPRPTDGTALVLDTTRGGVVNALYQEAAAYAFPDVEQGPEAFMTSVGALAGDGSGLHLDRPCTVLEAAAMANSLILNLYDWQDAGSLGLLWRADNGRGNVLYLLGSIHTDRNNLYPFHKQLRDVILNAEAATAGGGARNACGRR